MPNLSDAQDDGIGAFQIGIIAGANYVNVYDAQGEDFNINPKFAFVAGAFMTSDGASTTPRYKNVWCTNYIRF